MAMMPRMPAETSAPNGSNAKIKTAVENAPNKTLPAKRPNKMPVRDVGEASSRSKKPISISVPNAPAPATDPNRTP